MEERNGNEETSVANQIPSEAIGCNENLRKPNGKITARRALLFFIGNTRSQIENSRSRVKNARVCYKSRVDAGVAVTTSR